MKTILLKFAGPLQSWGTSSRFEIRETDKYPSKSAVIGMISACLGYLRSDDDKIKALNELGFAVRVDQPGTLLRDFHIAKQYKADNSVKQTYVTNRYYLQDAIFVVAIGSNNSELIDEIVNALKNPYFQPFLGRRSLPVTADYFINVFERPIIDCLQQFPWQGKSKNEVKLLDFYADSKLIENGMRLLKQDSVISFSQKHRKYGFRSITHFKRELNQIADAISEHDAFSIFGG